MWNIPSIANVVVNCCRLFPRIYLTTGTSSGDTFSGHFPEIDKNKNKYISRMYVYKYKGQIKMFFYSNLNLLLAKCHKCRACSIMYLISIWFSLFYCNKFLNGVVINKLFLKIKQF